LLGRPFHTGRKNGPYRSNPLEQPDEVQCAVARPAYFAKRARCANEKNFWIHVPKLTLASSTIEFFLGMLR
jgi:hypothetical protein